MVKLISHPIDDMVYLDKYKRLKQIGYLSDNKESIFSFHFGEIPESCKENATPVYIWEEVIEEDTGW